MASFSPARSVSLYMNMDAVQQVLPFLIADAIGLVVQLRSFLRRTLVQVLHTLG